jgi:hypothetical protein
MNQRLGLKIEAAEETGAIDGGLKSTMEDAPRWGITGTLCFREAVIRPNWTP